MPQHCLYVCYIKVSRQGNESGVNVSLSHKRLKILKPYSWWCELCAVGKSLGLVIVVDYRLLTHLGAKGKDHRIVGVLVKSLAFVTSMKRECITNSQEKE